MEQIYIYLAGGLVLGFLAGFITRTFTVARMKKSNKSLDGFRESERLRKETLLKENTALHESKKLAVETYNQEIKRLQAIIRRLDEDILLLQKSNEETEAMLQAGMPALHTLKLQLIESNNTIARYKAHLERITESQAGLVQPGKL